MLAPIVHALVARPAIYNLVQRLAGATVLHRRLAPYLADAQTVLDVGAGTGMLRALVPGAYVWLDTDQQKLRGYAGDCALLGDATALPMAAQSIDTGLCVAVSHHLCDAALPRLFSELARVCRRVIFLDAVWSPERWRGRLLWRYDRGAHPRTAESLRAAMAARFRLEAWETMTVQHRYVLGVGVSERR